MKRFTESVRLSLQNRNWYSALTLALTLPDVCGRLESPDSYSKDRYRNWFNRWMQQHYKHEVGPDREEVTFLSGGDCYALRCSYLHEGGADIRHQKARDALSNFHFITPLPLGGMIHCNMVNDALQLQVDIFCQQMADAADEWFESVKSDDVIRQRLESLLVIHDMSRGGRLL